MPKTIVLLLDGTSNTISDKRSNILRLYGCLQKSERQIVYYDPGVGTIGNPNQWSQLAQDASGLWGMATGMGIDENAKRAYRFILDHYDDGKSTGTEPDRICLFGYSRGAYTARMLAGFLHAVGLLENRNLNLLDYAWRAYKRVGEGNPTDAFAEVFLYDRILRPHRPLLHVLGLFDTVSSVIEPGPGLLPRLRHFAYTSKNPSVVHLRHALALDERRRLFQPVLWHGGDPDGFRPHPPQARDSREVWFTGTHCDVGGGRPEPVSALAKIPLLWMIDETRPLGLKYDEDTVNLLVRGHSRKHSYVPPDAFAPINETMKTAWRTLEYLPLPLRGEGFKLTRCRRRTVPAGALVHASVYARAERTGHLPMNLPQDAVPVGKIADWQPA